MNWIWTELDHRLYECMLAADGPLSTHDLAEIVGEDRSKVYRRLIRMHKLFDEEEASRGWIETDLADSPRPLYLFPTTGDVLTETNHLGIEGTIGDLKGIARTVKVPRGAQLSDDVKRKLMSKYRNYLDSMAASSMPGERAQIRKFENQLMAVLSNTVMSDVLGFIGLRKFTPKERVWETPPGAPFEIPIDRPSTISNDAAVPG